MGSQKLEIVERVSSGAVDEIFTYFHRHGLHPVCDSPIENPNELTRYWTWKPRTNGAPVAISVPKVEIDRARELLDQWRRQKRAKLVPISHRVRRDIAVYFGIVGAASILLSLVLRNIQLGIMYSIVGSLVGLLLISYAKAWFSK